MRRCNTRRADNLATPVAHRDYGGSGWSRPGCRRPARRADKPADRLSVRCTKELHSSIFLTNGPGRALLDFQRPLCPQLRPESEHRLISASCVGSQHQLLKSPTGKRLPPPLTRGSDRSPPFDSANGNFPGNRERLSAQIGNSSSNPGITENEGGRKSRASAQ